MSKDVNEIHEPQLNVNVIMDRNVSAVWVNYEDVEHFEVIGAVGSAKRHPGDTYDSTIALELATSRALRALSGKLLKRANRKVAEADAKRAAAERSDRPEKVHLTKKEWESLKAAAAKDLRVVSASASKRAPNKKKK